MTETFTATAKTLNGNKPWMGKVTAESPWAARNLATSNAAREMGEAVHQVKLFRGKREEVTAAEIWPEFEKVTSLACAPTKPATGSDLYECDHCAEMHSRADWLHFEDNYDGAPSETDTTGPGAAELNQRAMAEARRVK